MRRAIRASGLHLIKGEKLKKGEFGVMHGFMSVSQLKEAAHRYGVSINEFLVAATAYSIYMEDMHGVPGKRPIRVAVPGQSAPVF